MKYLPFLAVMLLLGACSKEAGKTVKADAAATVAAVSPNAAISDQLGTIRFEASANAEAQRLMNRGVKLMHHMMYAEADREFAAALQADPDCVLGYWARAMTMVHPLWPDVPSEAQRLRGRELLEQGFARAPRTPRETAYLEGLMAYYGDASNRTEPERLRALDEAWGSIAQRFPDDLEAACFAALFHLAPARFLPADKSHRIQLESAAIIQRVLAEIPDHPGAQHYKIHAFDFPLLAGRALEICETYGAIAPDVPHALHMPTHIYTRMGLWEQSIEFNRRSADAAYRINKAEGSTNLHYPHALDYLAYAYLQTGQYAEAGKIRDEVATMPGPFVGSSQPAIAFAFAAIPARFALERHNWAEAATLELGKPASFPWGEKFEHYESIVHFARALGAARSGQLELAEKYIAEHEVVARRVHERNPNSYWDVQAKVQLLASKGWVAFQHGEPEAALAMLRESAHLEATTEKEAVTPGEAIPASELLGDLLAEMNRPAEALAAYEAVLTGSPNRLNSLYGAARSAQQSGDAAKAAEHYKALIKIGAKADDGNDLLKHARAFLASK